MVEPVAPAALPGNAPISQRPSDELGPAFLSSLSPEQRLEVLRLDREWKRDEELRAMPPAQRLEVLRLEAQRSERERERAQELALHTLPPGLRVEALRLEKERVRLQLAERVGAHCRQSSSGSLSSSSCSLQVGDGQPLVSSGPLCSLCVPLDRCRPPLALPRSTGAGSGEHLRDPAPRALQ